jgi:hypothetical protein
MAELCLTGEGTTWLGLYHGLSIRLQGSGFRVEFFEGNLADLDVATTNFPALLCCQLTSEVDIANPNYREDAGWKPGVAHSAVLFGYMKDFHENVYVVGDPSQKHVEFWSQQDIENLWTGQGLQIVTTRR